MNPKSPLPLSQQELILVFADVKEQVERGTIEHNSITTRHNFHLSVPNGDITSPGYDTLVETVNSDTVSAARVLSKSGKTCILNMASSTRAGGGVAHGSRARLVMVKKGLIVEPDNNSQGDTHKI